MILPTDFQFNQANLQDYVDCRRRFQLRYLLQIAWPAIGIEPALEHERLLRLGAELHRMIQQHTLGVSEERLNRVVQDDDLNRWWQNYLQFLPANLPQERHPEILLSAPIAGHRLVAKLDLLAINPGERVVIVDWKTSLRRPSKRWLVERLQTRVYRYMIVRAGSYLNRSEPIHPEQVEMIYWFANYPGRPERLGYDDVQCKADDVFLNRLVAEIEGLDEGEFDLTDQNERCRYCYYRSLCLRGVKAGEIDSFREEIRSSNNHDADLEFNQIAESEY